MIYDVTTDSSDPHFGPLFHSIDELCKQTPLRMLEVSQVNLDQEVYIA